MQYKRTFRGNSHDEDNLLGIYNWFLLRGIKDEEVVRETVHNFCNYAESDFKKITWSYGQKVEIFNWVSDRFSTFSNYADKFLIENNYK